MAKKVFGSHDSLAHTWASQNPDYPEGRSADKRMFFDGPTLYSYGRHFAIARFVTSAISGHRAVLFNSAGYSVSTGKHKSIARRALVGLDLPTYYVEDPDRDPTLDTLKMQWIGVQAAFKALARQTPDDLNVALSRFDDLVYDLNTLADFFGIDFHCTVPTLADDVKAKILTRIVQRDMRQEVKRVERTRAYDDAQAKQKADYLAGGIHYYYAPGSWSHNRFTEAEHAQHFAAWEVIQRDTVAAWRAGKPVSLAYDDTDHTLMRVNGDVIQTSRGAEFPVSHGKRAFQLIAECRAMGRHWERNGHKIALGAFQIDRIEADGTVKAGCHTVAWSEIERCAKELGLF